MKINFKAIIICLICLIIVFSICIIRLLVREKKEEIDTNTITMSSEYRTSIGKNSNVNLMNSDVMLAKNAELFFEKSAKYYGSYSKEIQESWFEFASQVVPKYYKVSKSEENLKNYYENNSSKILTECGIESEKEFVELVQKISKMNKPQNLKQMEISDVDLKDKIATANIRCTYENNEILFQFDVTKNAKTKLLNIKYK